MVTMKLVGNVIACDDASSTVSLINPELMQKFASIKPPIKGSFLYSAYKHAQSKTILLAYDSKKMIGIDSENFSQKMSINLEKACMKFTEFHDDSHLYVILACEGATVLVFNFV